MTTTLFSAPSDVPPTPEPRPWAPEAVPAVIAALLPRTTQPDPSPEPGADEPVPPRAAEICAYPWRLRWRDAVMGPDTPAGPRR